MEEFSRRGELTELSSPANSWYVMGKEGSIGILDQGLTNLLKTKRIPLRWAVLFAVVGALALLVAGFLLWLRGSDDWQFVERVLLASEHGWSQQRVTRWIKSPTIAVDNATDEDLKQINAFVEEINEILVGTGIFLQLGKTRESDISIVFTSVEDFQSVADGLGREFEEGNVGFYWVWPNERFELDRAVIVIASELTKRKRRRAILHELVHALGLFNHSHVFPSSIIYQTANETTSATQLALIDRKIIRFLYLRLVPGDSWEEVRWAFETHWPR